MKDPEPSRSATSKSDTVLPNLNDQYESAVSLITEYFVYQQSLLRTLMSPVSLLRMGMSGFRRVLREYNRIKTDLSVRNSPMIIELTAKYATEEQKKSPFYRICTADYTLNELSKELASKYPDLAFEKLAKYHKTRRLWQTRRHMINKRLIAILFGAGMFALRTTPKLVVELFNINYDTFQIVVFLGTLIAVAYLAIVFWGDWRTNLVVKNKFDFVTEVLEYAAFQQDTDPNKGPPAPSFFHSRELFSKIVDRLLSR